MNLDAKVIYENLSDDAKRRTSPENVQDVVAAIEWMKEQWLLDTPHGMCLNRCPHCDQ